MATDVIPLEAFDIVFYIEVFYKEVFYIEGF